MPTVERCGCGSWTDRHGCAYFFPRPAALVLRTANGTIDQVGMSRAREVLARAEGMKGWESGVIFATTTDAVGAQLSVGDDARWYPCTVAEKWTEPDALARLLAERAGVEVVRG